MNDTWPGGARAAVAFTFDVDAEEVWLAGDPQNAGRPGVLSQGVYGVRVALPRILELLARHGVTATFFVPGRVAERYPDRVRSIVEGGHELAHHGLSHRSPTELDRATEEAELVEAKGILSAFGTSVVGYRSPSWDLSPNTLDLLRAHGFRYSSNLMDDDRPYLHDGDLVEIPVQWILDDAPHFWFDADSWTKRIASAAEVRAIWLEEFEGVTRLGGCTVFTLHPQLIGRPGRLAMLDDVIATVLERDDVWIAPCRAISEHALRDPSRALR